MRTTGFVSRATLLPSRCYNLDDARSDPSNSRCGSKVGESMPDGFGAIGRQTSEIGEIVIYMYGQ